MSKIKLIQKQTLILPNKINLPIFDDELSIEIINLYINKKLIIGSKMVFKKLFNSNIKILLFPKNNNFIEYLEHILYSARNLKIPIYILPFTDIELGKLLGLKIISIFGIINEIPNIFLKNSKLIDWDCNLPKLNVEIDTFNSKK